ncbi:hypothetical protein [Robbsia andropogonis]|uniref:hypothetical protein n=1 Tax=Robbsia andropogonis TaxID=28092 RepID=UPI002A69E72B|nr:hypothetical protein [Robbsia andropogonis]
MTYAVTLTRTTATKDLASGTTAGGVRFQLLSATDSSVVATYDDASAGLSHTFTGVADASLIPSVQDLDSTGAALGSAVAADAFTPSALVSATTTVTYAATASVGVSVVAE